MLRVTQQVDTCSNYIEVKLISLCSLYRNVVQVPQLYVNDSAGETVVFKIRSILMLK